MMKPMKVVLLDRDGTLIVDPENERVMSIDDIMLFSDTISALKTLSENGFVAIMITNQAAIAEGTITSEKFENINAEVLRRIEPSGLKFLKVYMCPHSKNDECSCRKPNPEMLIKAAEEFGFNLSEVFMVGDRPADVMAGKNAGTKAIQTKTATHLQEIAPEADYVADTLTDAVEHIISQS